jgi:hypothetical protein
MQPVLGAPGDLQHVVGLAGLAVLQRDADRWSAKVVQRGLDQQSPGDRGAGLGDRALVGCLAGLIQRWRQTEPARQPARGAEALPVAAELVGDCCVRRQRPGAARRLWPRHDATPHFCDGSAWVTADASVCALP